MNQGIYLVSMSAGRELDSVAGPPLSPYWTRRRVDTKGIALNERRAKASSAFGRPEARSRGLARERASVPFS